MRIFYSNRHTEHSPRAFLSRGQLKQCPEVPQRAEILLKAVEEAGHQIVEPEVWGFEPVEAIHDAGYLQFLQTAWDAWVAQGDAADEIVPNVHPGRHMRARPDGIVGQAGYYQTDTACPIGPGTWQAARASADCALSAAKQIMTEGDGTAAYALCRPPGHHAFSDMAGGFCFLNNTAIATQFCLANGARRVAVVDIDVHHGNGTQQIFYARDDVLTVSLHGDPSVYYPFYLGYADETGSESGLGFNLNLPLPQGTDDAAYLPHLRTALDRVREFSPDVLVVALGLDASEHDGHQPFFKISTQGFSDIAGLLAALNLPSVLVQEGGYVSDYLGRNLAAALHGFETARR